MWFWYKNRKFDFLGYLWMMYLIIDCSILSDFRMDFQRFFDSKSRFFRLLSIHRNKYRIFDIFKIASLISLLENIWKTVIISSYYSKYWMTKIQFISDFNQSIPFLIIYGRPIWNQSLRSTIKYRLAHIKVDIFSTGVHWNRVGALLEQILSVDGSKHRDNLIPMVLRMDLAHFWPC